MRHLNIKAQRLFLVSCMAWKFLLPVLLNAGNHALQASVTPQILITPEQSEYTVHDYLRILEDKESVLDIHQILTEENQKRFVVSEGGIPNYGFSKSVFWFEFRVKNEDAKNTDWFLEVGYPLLDYVTLYQTDTAGHWIASQSGDQISFDQRKYRYRNIIFRLSLSPGKDYVFYIRVHGESSIQLPLKLCTETVFLSKTLKEQFIYGGFYGILVLMALYNLFFFFTIKDKSYLYYVLYISFYIIGQMGLDGYAYELLWPGNPALNNPSISLFLGLALLFCAQFTKAYLQTKVIIPKVNLILNIYMAGTLVPILLSLIGNYPVAISMIAVLSLMMSVILVPSGILCWTKGYRPARYFLLGWVAYLLGVNLFALKSFGILPSTFITNYSMLIGIIMQTTLLSLGLSNRFNMLKQELAEQTLQKEKLKREKEAEHKALIEAQKQELEKQVAERTRDLLEKKEELEKINMIVKAINSEINFSALLETLLKEVNILRNAHRACIFVQDRESENFKVKMTRGWSQPSLTSLVLTPSEVETLLIGRADRLFEDIYLLKGGAITDKHAIDEILGAPPSRLILRIHVEQKTEGYFIFDNLDAGAGFSSQDLHLLFTLKEHITSAFIKANILEELKIVNEKKNEFLGIAAHDLRSPLGAVIGFVELVVEDLKSGRFNKEDAINDLSMVLKSGRDMVQLISDLLDISAIEAGKVSLELHRENMAVILEECEKMHRKTAMMKNIALDIEKRSDLPMVTVDKIRIIEVVNNLLSNAIKYTFPGGSVRVYCESSPTAVITHIRDTGQGLSENDLREIFTSFKKLSARPTGGESSTGFGLAIVKKIVELHKGKVWVESELGKGSTFSFSLPTVA